MKIRIKDSKSLETAKEEADCSASETVKETAQDTKGEESEMDELSSQKKPGSRGEEECSVAHAPHVVEVCHLSETSFFLSVHLKR
jgi:hypothetical protein